MIQNPFLILIVLLIQLIQFLNSESPNCVAVYKEGGAPAVFESPKCPRWIFPSVAEFRLRHHPSGCHVSVHQGRRPYQEDRTVCALDIKIPFIEKKRIREINVGIIAVFDGHNGAEASDMASELLLDYFLLHAYFLLDAAYSALIRNSVKRLSSSIESNVDYQVLNLSKEESWNNHESERLRWMLPIPVEGPFHLEILKESLLRTIDDIDATFSKEALAKNLLSGTTATVVIKADGHILAANIGDSKSLICSDSHFASDKKAGNESKVHIRKRRYNNVPSPLRQHTNFQLAKSDVSTFYVKELTEDHHPDRTDEKSRVEAFGGYVLEWAGVPRVNGELAISRAIGDIPFKKYGVLSTPEVTDWILLSSNDSFLVAASDGVFEKMTTKDVCHILFDAKNRTIRKLNYLSECIIQTAYRKGTIDNMAAIVIPLESTQLSQFIIDDDSGDHDITSGLSSYGQEKAPYKLSAAKSAASTSLMPLEYYYQIMSKFNHLLVETKHKSSGCFYLTENLNDDVDYVFQAPEDDKVDVHEFHSSYEDINNSYFGGSLVDVYKDQSLCWHFGLHDGDKGQCTSPQIFAKFVGLLDSIPYTDSRTNSSDSSYPHDFRYVLKRRFDRGSYGEVWLAFHWNCSEDSYEFAPLRNFAQQRHGFHLSPDGSNTHARSNSSDNYCFSESNEDDLLILKRIMVERGHPAYLSGLREKYFGEIFSDASAIQDSALTRLSSVFSVEEYLDASSIQAKNLVDTDESGFKKSFSGSFKCKVNIEEGLNHIARYVESFESKAKEIWLVFKNEGVSLSKLIYTAEVTKTVADDENNEVRNVKILRPSSWWYWLRTTKEGEKEMKNLIRQLLLALKSCHDRVITHRDIKPENMIICFENVQSRRCSREIPRRGEPYNLKMRIIDFGSAIDEFTLKHLYGTGPTRSEQTFEYTPPEALLNASWFQEQKNITLKYDMWSVGVVMLELITGSPHIFQINDRTRALLDKHLEGWSENTKELAYKLRSYMEMCILIPGVSSHQNQHKESKDHGGVWLASWKCSEESFAQQVKSKDPLKLGFPNIWALRLARQLLLWHPEDRLSVDEALNHPYFQ